MSLLSRIGAGISEKLSATTENFFIEAQTSNIDITYITAVFFVLILPIFLEKGGCI